MRHAWSLTKNGVGLFKSGAEIRSGIKNKELTRASLNGTRTSAPAASFCPFTGPSGQTEFVACVWTCVRTRDASAARSAALPQDGYDAAAHIHSDAAAAANAVDKKAGCTPRAGHRHLALAVIQACAEWWCPLVAAKPQHCKLYFATTRTISRHLLE